MLLRLVRSSIVAGTFWLGTLLPVAAGPALLYDATTGQVLYAEDADHPWFPASLTKMMTAYLVFETLKAGKAERAGTLTISARANSRPKMRLGLGAGKVITYDEAMAALILLSANDIAVALAEAVAGSEPQFVETMNATALRLGMASTRFINANGLPGEGQHSTARDLATLTQALLRDFPEHAGLFALLSAPVGKRTVSTHNPVLVRLPGGGGDGMKTGFTCSAGYNIVASATRDGTKLVAIVLGEQTPVKREARTNALIEHGFRMLHWKAIFPPTTLDKLPVEPFDAEQVRAANLVKRWKDCQAPEPVLDADGNPVCPVVKVAKGAKAGRAVKVIKAMRTIKRANAKPDPCTPAAVAKLKTPSLQPTKAKGKVVSKVIGKADNKAAGKVVAKAVAKRVAPARAADAEAGGAGVFGSAQP